MIYCRIIKAMSVSERLLIERNIKSTNPQSWEYLLFLVIIYRATALYYTYYLEYFYEEWRPAWFPAYNYDTFRQSEP